MPTIHSAGLFARFESEFRPYIDQLGIPEAVFVRHDVEIPTLKYAELLKIVARESNPYIGLEMGEKMAAEDLGVVGHAIAATSDIRQMLSLLAKYLYVFSQSNTMRIDQTDNRVVINYQATILTPDLIAQDADCALAFVTTLIRRHSGMDFHPRQVEFQHSAPTSTSRHRQYFGCEVLFDRPANRLHCDRSILKRPLNTSDSGLLEALLFYLDDRLLMRSEEGDLPSKVRHMISNSLAQGVPDLKKIARQLGMSGRTLQRKLQEHSLNFADMVDAIRLEIAQEYLDYKDFSLTDLSLMLGYGELSSFSRAYKRMTGISPEQARQQLL